MPEKVELTEHVDRTVEEIAQVHRDHARGAGVLQRLAARITAVLARPLLILVVALAVGAWICVNSWRAAHGLATPDPPPFANLELAATLFGVALAALILATQRRDDLLDEQRSQLILELGLLSDRKAAKLIALLEELRRDAPGLADRVDRESEAMSQPTDTRAVLGEIRKRAETDDG